MGRLAGWKRRGPKPGPKIAPVAPAEGSPYDRAFRLRARYADAIAAAGGQQEIIELYPAFSGPMPRSTRPKGRKQEKLPPLSPTHAEARDRHLREAARARGVLLRAGVSESFVPWPGWAGPYPPTPEGGR